MAIKRTFLSSAKSNPDYNRAPKLMNKVMNAPERVAKVLKGFTAVEKLMPQLRNNVGTMEDRDS